MTNSPVIAPACKASAQHLELSQCHQDAVRLVRLLRENLPLVFQPDLAQTKKQAIAVGHALERIANAERNCGCCSGQDHVFSKSYQEMLEHHRLAYIDFERLSSRLENKVSPLRGEIDALAADVEHQLNAAETTHQTSIRPTALKKTQ